VGGLELFFFYLFAAASPLSIAAINTAQGGLTLFFLGRLVKRRWRPTVPEWILLAYVAWNLLSALLSPMQAVAVRGVLNHWSWSALFVASSLPSTIRAKADRFTGFLALSACLTVPLSLAEFFLGTDPRRDALFKHVPVGTIQAYGLFSHHLTYAGVMTTVALFLGARALYGPAKGRAWWWASSLASGTAVLLSLARTYLVALVPGSMVLLWRKGKLPVLAALAAGALLAVLVLGLGPPQLRGKITSLWDLEHASNAERIYLWASGLHMLRERPAAGWGCNVYEEVSAAFKAPYAEKVRYPNRPPGFKTTEHCHSLYLMLAIQSGLPGLALFLAFAAACFVRLRRCGDPALRYGATAAFAAFLAGGLFEWNGGDAEVATLVFFVVGLALGDRESVSP
jgi:O-antigen ligase